MATLLGFAIAHDEHGGQHIPKLLGGRRFLSTLGLSRPGPLLPQKSRVASEPIKYAPGGDRIGPRQIDDNIDGPCGPGFGSCAPEYCCSSGGWCGKGLQYCSAPDCQINYATGCDGNKKPVGPDTFSVERTKVGKILYGGAGVYECVKTGDIALTFDDGPYIYTGDLLDKLKSYGAKATFFLTGNNLGKGQINDPKTMYPAMIRRMHADGHQIASHTWSHQNASQLTNTQFTNQMVWNEIALNSILGFFPTYMRPPYSICERNCQNILATLGYHTIYFDLDTAGYLNDNARQIQNSKDIWDRAMRTSDPSRNSFLQIEHDIHTQIVHNLTDYILTSLFSNGYRAVTVGECLGDPPANWYRPGPGGVIVPTTSAVVSVPPTASTTTTPIQSTSIRSTTSRPRTTTTRTSSTISTRSTVPFPTTRRLPTIRTTVRRTTSTTSTTSTTGGGTRITLPAPTGTTGIGQSTDGTCGNGITCDGTRFGACCSLFGFCGVGDDYCLTDNGCQVEYGSCDGEAPPEQPGEIVVSQDGRCGPESSQTCADSTFGICCGSDGICNSTTISCLSILGCQKDYGYCI